MCPNCGAGVIPLPMLDGGKRVAWTGAPTGEFRMGSRGGDIAAGIALGVIIPPLFVGVALTPCLLPTWIGAFGLVLVLLVPVTFGVLIYSVNRKRDKYPVMSDALQKTLYAWLIALCLGLIGLFTGTIKI